jgi:hypothetical protein
VKYSQGGSLYLLAIVTGAVLHYTSVQDDAFVLGFRIPDSRMLEYHIPEIHFAIFSPQSFFPFLPRSGKKRRL